VLLDLAQYWGKLEFIKIIMAKSKTIFYAEDDPVVRRVYKQCLEQAGYSVNCAEDGLEAIKYLKASSPDLVILDLLMPKFTGEDVLQFICTEAHLHEKPLIILSNNSQVEKGYEKFSGRADIYLEKHQCTPAILLQKVHELFAGPQMDSADDLNSLREESPHCATPLNHGVTPGTCR
jgi:CheY-like chemotaxis protein